MSVNFLTGFICLYNFFSHSYDLFVAAPLKLSGHRAENTGRNRFILRVYYNRRILIKTEISSVSSPEWRSGTNHNAADDVLLFGSLPRFRGLDGGDKYVSYPRVAMPGTSKYAETAHKLCARVIRYFQDGTFLYHVI